MATEKDIILKVDHVSKYFKLPHERQNSLKERVLSFRKPSFDTFHALDDISFEVRRGEFLGIVGRNGSGKSTLLKIIGGIYQPTKGSVTVNGTLTPFIELGIGFNPELTGRENVFLNGAILGLTRKEIEKKYHEIVAYAELEKFMDQKIKNYSSGMQVRLAFSISLQAHNDILLIDEVLAVGDLNFQRKCFQSFRDIKKSGKTVVFVTHDMQSIMDFCDRAILVNNSKLIQEGEPDIIAKEYFKLNNDTSEQPMTPVDQENRWGNQKAVVTKIKATNVDKSEITITAECVFNEKIEQPVFGFSIHDPRGQKIVESNTLWNGVKTAVYKSGQKVTIVWTVANIFSNGRHAVTVALADSSGSEFYDWWDEAANFTINKRAVTSALILPEQTIKVEAK